MDWIFDVGSLLLDRPKLDHFNSGRFPEQNLFGLFGVSRYMS